MQVSYAQQRSTLYQVEAIAPIPIEQLAGLNVPVKWIEKGFMPWKHARQLFGDAVNHLKVVKWREETENLVTTVGLNDALDKHLKGSGYTAAWYVGLTTGTPTFAAGDTMSSHAGWTEFTNYDEAARQTLTLGTVAAGSVDNVGNEASFTISTNGSTIGGAFMVTVSTKGGSTGTIYGGAAFTAGNKGLDDGDTLNVTVTATATSS